MSLLEDVFLEDEAGEAQQLERIIEGDGYDDGPDSNDNSEKEDEAEEDKRHVDPTSDKPKRVVRNPRIVLNPARLTGPRGIHVIPEHFKDFKFKGKGHEKEDLDLVLKKLEHWAYRLYPKFEFKDCLKKIETLGNKRPVMVHLTKVRSDQFASEESVVQRDSSDEGEAPEPALPAEDEFDKLLQQQIELARTPRPDRRMDSDTPMFNKPFVTPRPPQATSSPSISEEQKQRMLRNRQMAEQRRLARLALNTTNNNSTQASEDTNTSTKSTDEQINTHDTIIDETENDDITKVKTNRSNVIDSSDDEDGLVVNESVVVHVHHTGNGVLNVDEANKLPGDDNNSDHSHEINKAIDKTQDCQENETSSEANGNPGTEDRDIEMNDVNNPKDLITDTDDSSKAINESDVEKITRDDKIAENLENCTEQSENRTEQSEISSENVGDSDEVAKISEVNGNNDIETMKDMMDVDFDDDF